MRSYVPIESMVALTYCLGLILVVVSFLLLVECIQNLYSVD